MSYADGYSNKQNRVLTGGVVAVMQVGLAVAIVSAFAVKDIIKVPEERTGSVFVPAAPRPTEPPPPPEVEPREQVRTESHITVPETRTTLAPTNPVEVPFVPGPPSTDALGKDTIFIPPVGPTPEPSPLYTPKSAVPKGRYAGWVTTSDYPTSDLRKGNQGTVRFRLGIDAAGQVTDCRIVESSGFPGLDEATCKYASKRARFEAATDETGRKVAGSWTSAVRWMIPND